MAKIPLVCMDCEALTLGEPLDLPGQATIGGNVYVNACPAEGCTGDLTDIPGTYDFVGDTARMLESDEVEEEEINDLIDILSQAEEENWTAHELETALESSAPNFAWLSKYIPENQTLRTLLISLLMLLISNAYDTYLSHKERQQDRRQHRERMEQLEELEQRYEKIFQTLEEDSSDVSVEKLKEVIQRFGEEFEARDRGQGDS